MATEELWTFADATERLLDNFGQYGSSGRNHRIAREAVLNAYRTFPSMHPWTYYKRRHMFQSSANYQTGTIAYDLTGHASGERAFELTSGTWPTDAAFGVIQLSQNHWPVAERISNTVVLGMVDRAPSADIAAGTAYEWYRESYPYPVRTRRTGQLIDNAQFSHLNYISPEEALLLSRNRTGGTINRPELYTIRNDDRYMNTLSFVLVPPPNTEKTYEYIEEASGQQLTTEKVSDTGTISAASKTLTLGTAVLDSTLHPGCVVRIADTGDAVEPTSLRGNLDTYNPYTTQRIIASVTSTTVCELDSAAVTGATAAKVVISSPIDVETDSMLTAFWSLCDWEFVKRGNDKDIRRVRHHEDTFWKDLALAQEADRRSTEVQSAHQRVGFFPAWLPVGSVDPSP